MTTRQRATLADLYQVAGKAELVGGEIVLMSPTGVLPKYAADEIYASLRDYVRKTGRGIAMADNGGFVVRLPNRQSFSPDAAYISNIQIGMGFYHGSPDFAAEVRSEGDYGPTAEIEMAAKRADYFAAGTLVVWDVDLRGPDTVRVYRADSPTTPTVYRRGELAEAEPAVPGWTMPVDDLFLDLYLSKRAKQDG